jgi:DNA-binding Xre family transcriptional regulator
MTQKDGPKMRWKVKEFLEQHGKTPYALIKASGLTQTTIYGISQGKPTEARFQTLESLIRGLEALTGKQVELTDVLEVVRDAP